MSAPASLPPFLRLLHNLLPEFLAAADRIGRRPRFADRLRHVTLIQLNPPEESGADPLAERLLPALDADGCVGPPSTFWYFHRQYMSYESSHLYGLPADVLEYTRLASHAWALVPAGRWKGLTCGDTWDDWTAFVYAVLRAEAPNHFEMDASRVGCPPDEWLKTTLNVDLFTASAVAIELLTDAAHVERILTAEVDRVNGESVTGPPTRTQGIAGSVETGTPSGDATADAEFTQLTDRQYAILDELLTAGAVSRETRRTTEEVAVLVDGKTANAKGFKTPVSHLRKAGLLQTRRGNGSGIWLSQAGRQLAERRRADRQRKEPLD